MDLRETIVFDAAGYSEQLVRSLGNDSQNPYLAFQRTFQMLSIRIMSWDFDRTN
jgi:hypothetical protein